MEVTKVLIPRAWRSQILLLVLFLFSTVATVALTSKFPWTIVTGTLFSYNDSRVILHLPVLMFIPIITIGLAAYQIYNVKYYVDVNGLETRVGVLALNQRVSRVRYEDIKSVEFKQTLFERVLNIGTVEVGTAATGEVEILFSGIIAPNELQEMISFERDKRQRLLLVEAVDSVDKVTG